MKVMSVGMFYKIKIHYS